MTTRGERLRSYLLEKTGGQSGWQAELVRKSGVKRQTISKWTSKTFDSYPDMDTLALVADALEVRPFEILAVLDGDGPVVSLDDRFREMIREEIRALQRGPGRAPRE